MAYGKIKADAVIWDNGGTDTEIAVSSMGSGGLASQQVFTTTGTSTWTKPSGITKVKVIVTGGGGGGAGGQNEANCGSSGAAGGTAIEIIDVSSVSSVTVTVGTGGPGGSSDGAGTGGGTSSFGTYCSATGGDRGLNNAAYSNTSRSLGGAGTGGDINITGGAGGQAGGGNTSDSNSGQRGGASYWGGGGTGGSMNVGAAASSGIAYGSGGGGGNHHTGNEAPGANGAPGIVVVEEYK
ncbi:tail fiber assembly [Synechococcus phage S-RIP2]|uniref:Glycine-rich domain-containing protein n=2 Tax=Sednavirus SRIP2 TaxID=2733955 RepID=M4T4B2_9CAUD|nr:tail fiber assembly [Synechococcus phage S-RIP2]YP_007676331.1 tail fiber assembly [Cyanophage KBS-P-1A]AGG91303.1 hypothetical protein SWQG_00006 [Synechococcus phage S-RIP2]AGH57704.1 hypothetical protein CYZG_00009 [Cyanophage KBS-P-1A]